MKRIAALAALALGLAACGGSTGVRDAGRPPVVPGPDRTVRLWFIRPGGRVGVERDLVPVTTHLRAYADELPFVVLKKLQEGPSNQLRLAGYRSALGCCTDTRAGRGGLVVRGGDVTVPVMMLPPLMYVGSMDQRPPPSWFVLAAAAQIQLTLSHLAGVSSVVVRGLTQTFVRTQLEREIDPTASRTPRGSCADAMQHGTLAELTATRTSRSRIVAHVRAPRPLVLELDWNTSSESGPENTPFLATTVPCGSFDVVFSGDVVSSTAQGFQVRAVPLAGPPQPGVVRGVPQFTAQG